MPSKAWFKQIGLLCITTYCTLLSEPILSDEFAWQNPSYIQNAFNEVALKNEYQQTDLRVLKWLKPIHYQFVYHDMPSNSLIESLCHTHLAHLAKITQHAIKHDPKSANLTIHLTRDALYEQVIKKVGQSPVKNLARDSHCMGTFKSTQRNEIISGTIIIPVDHAYSRGLMTACVVEETTQLMGLPNDSDWVNPSIANDASKLDLLTGLDYLLLKILYTPALTPGMSYNLSQPIIQRTIQEMLQNGTVQKAHEWVNQQGIYPLLYR